jgi:hypothetical protein
MQMSFDEIREYNALIGEYMGFKSPEKSSIKRVNYLTKNNKTGKEFTIESCKYHSSWDWLFPVIQKICREGCRYYFYINEEHIKAEFTNMDIPGKKIASVKLYDYKNSIDAAYLAVIEYIKPTKIIEEITLKNIQKKNSPDIGIVDHIDLIKS